MENDSVTRGYKSLFKVRRVSIGEALKRLKSHVSEKERSAAEQRKRELDMRALEQLAASCFNK